MRDQHLAFVLARRVAAAPRPPRGPPPPPGSHDGKLVWMIALATLPIVIVGLAFKHRVESLSSLYLISGTLIGIGIAMAIIDHFAAGREGRTIATLTFVDALLVGLAQTLA